MSVLEIADTTWLTASVRPAGRFGRSDVDRLRAVLEALSATASMVVLDLQAARLQHEGVAAAIDDAAAELERRGGCLLCVNADADTCARLARCRHAVVVGESHPSTATA